MPDAPPSTSLWRPLRHPTFREFWLASLVSNLGTLMQSVGAAWLMTSLSTSPLLVALVQTATNLPTFLLALPAGALADVIDRRRLILVTQAWMLASAALLGVLALTHHATPAALLALTFSIGVGAALNAPALQSVVPDLVSRDELTEAITLNSAGFNLARAAGPALGGLVIAVAGVGMTFMVNAASFLAVLVSIYRWRPEPTRSLLPAERMREAIRGGLSYVRHSPSLRSILVRAGAFIVFASSLWALLPLLARFTLQMGPTGYGVLLGFFGGGAVAAALQMPRIRLAARPDVLLAVGTLIYAAALGVLAVSSHPVAAALGLVLAGGAWLFNLSTFNTSIQASVPAWIRGRTMALYLLVVFGGLSLASPLWGALAAALGLSGTLLAAALGMAGTLALSRRFRLDGLDGVDLTESAHWPEPFLVTQPHYTEGPVFVSVAYQIDPSRAPEFREAMREVRRLRLRNGALRWNLLRDTAVPGRYVESFVDASWAAHMRLHQRPTVTDRAVEERAWRFHVGDRPPTITHYIAEGL